MAFLDCLQLFWWSRPRNHCKKIKKNQQKPQQTTNITVKTKKNQKNYNFQTLSQNRVLVVFLGFYSGLSRQDLETTVKTNHQNHCKNQEKNPKPQQTTKTTVKTKKSHQNFRLRDSLKIVVFLVVLGFYSDIGGLLWFLVVFLGFYSGFEVLTTKTIVKKQKKPPKLSFER